MFGTDAIHLPEMNWLGALVGRRGLTTALTNLVATDALTPAEAEEVAGRCHPPHQRRAGLRPAGAEASDELNVER
jgi:hypothetical protein